MREITILDIEHNADGDLAITVVLWLVPPPQKRYRLLPSASAIPWLTDEEVAAVTSGAVIEVTRKTGWMPGNSSAATMRAAVVALAQAEQSLLDTFEAGDNLIGAYRADGAWVTNALPLPQAKAPKPGVMHTVQTGADAERGSSGDLQEAIMLLAAQVQKTNELLLELITQ